MITGKIQWWIWSTGGRTKYIKINLNMCYTRLYYNYCTYTNTLTRLSAPALAIYASDGWNATSNIDSSNFFRWAVISCTQVLLSKFHILMDESWPITNEIC